MNRKNQTKGEWMVGRLKGRLTILLFSVGLIIPVRAEMGFVPTDPATVIERLPADGGASAGLRKDRAALRARPNDKRLAVSVAEKYIATGRISGDPRFYEYAHSAIQPWWTTPAKDAGATKDVDNPGADVLYLRATIKQFAHEFSGALSDVDLLLAHEPTEVRARLLRAAILDTQGRYKEAFAESRNLWQSPEAALACAAAAESYTGQSRSYELLNRIFTARPPTDAVERRWLITTLADIAFRLEKWKEAEPMLKRALADPQRPLSALVTYSDLLLAENRAADAVKLLENEQADALLIRLAIAEKAANDARLPKLRANLRERFAINKARGDNRHMREEAMFELDIEGHSAAALQLARQNFKVQREPEDLLILVRSARAAKNAEAIKEATSWVKTSGVEDVRLTRYLVDCQS